MKLTCDTCGTEFDSSDGYVDEENAQCPSHAGPYKAQIEAEYRYYESQWKSARAHVDCDHGAYEITDPKHPDYRERMLDRADLAKKERGES